jgi:uncharacterized protein YjbJ (UPF0337 family)
LVASPLLLHLLLAREHSAEAWIFRTANRHRDQAEEQIMSTKDRASNRAQDAKGRVKEAAGRITGHHDLKNKGMTDQAKAGMKKSLEDAGYKVEGAATP